MTLEMRNTDDEQGLEVCLEENGFRSCCFVSSIHLAYSHEQQLREANLRKAMAAFDDPLA